MFIDANDVEDSIQTSFNLTKFCICIIPKNLHQGKTIFNLGIMNAI